MRTTKSPLWLFALILVSPNPTDQTRIIRRTNESEVKTIDAKTIDDRKKDTHLPNDDGNFLTYKDFNKQATKNESYLRIANYSPTSKENESLNGTKTAIDTIVDNEDDHNTSVKTTKDGTASTDLVQEKVLKEAKKLDLIKQMKDDYIKENKESKHLDEDENYENNEFFIESVEHSKDELGNFRENHNKTVKESGLKIEARDIKNAVDYGMRALEDLVKVKEPLLYKLGLFLNDNDPAARLASFGAPVTGTAILLSRIGYATLEASRKIAESFPKNFGRQSAGIPIELQSRIELDECPLRGRPRCPPASRRFRTSDGTCNNPKHPWRGASMLPMQRFLPPVYEDGIQSVRHSVRGMPLPSPREISTVIHRDKNLETQSVTLMFMQWGQFIDHDITSTVKSISFNGSVPRCCEGGGRRVLPSELLHPSCLPIEVPPTDPFLSRFGIGCMEFIRSAPSTRIDCELGWREQINQVTPYIDASTIYGSDVDTSDSIRTFTNGNIFYGRPSSLEPLNPPDPPGGELCRAGALSKECLQPGDGRITENPGLVAMHTVFVRYHNKISNILSQINSHWSDERVYQETRRIVYSVMQHITYREYLPLVLGPEVMDLFELRVLKKGHYDKYDSRINPAIANSFSTAAFRFGHSLVQNSFVRSDSHHIPLPNNVSLHNENFNFENIWSFGSLDRFMLGMSNQPSQRRDEFIADELTNHLFQFSDAVPFGMDLASINIQRGRDHGLPPYIFWREPCGLSPIKDWRDLEQVMSISSAIRLRSLYAHIDDIDLFTAGLAEKPLRGAVVGPTFACIIAQQFSTLRKGDRFWYENEGFESSFSPAQLQQLRKVSLAQVICQTLHEVETIQPFVFLSADSFRNVRASCDSPEIRNFDLGAWTEQSFEFNSISDNVDSFDLEQSQKNFFDLTRLGRTDKNPRNINKDYDLNILDDLYTVPELKEKLLNVQLTTNQPNITSFNQTTNTHRHKRDTKKIKEKKSKNTTYRPRTSTAKFKTKATSRRTKTVSTVKPKITDAELKYDTFSNIPKRPIFLAESNTKPTKNKPNYYEIRDHDHNDVTYLLGLVPERTTKVPVGIPVQLNINIHYEPQRITTTTSKPLPNKKKKPNFSVRPPSSLTTTESFSKPIQTYDNSNVVVITKRPKSTTRRPIVTTRRPDKVSYPSFSYSPAYDRPSGYTTKKPTYFFDNIEYVTTTGHKRPNSNAYYSNDDDFIKVPQQTVYQSTNGHYFYNDQQDIYDNSNKRPIHIHDTHHYTSTVFEDQPFSSSNRPIYIKADRYRDKQPTSINYFDDDSDTIIITGNQRRPDTTTYNNDGDKLTDDILDEFFHRHSTKVESTNRKSTDVNQHSTPKTKIDDKLDFKSRIVYRNNGDRRSDFNSDGFVEISAVKKEVFGRVGEDVIEEGSTAAEQMKSRRRVKKIKVVDIDVSPSEKSGQWKIFNATEDVPAMEIPELPMNIPCSYEVPKPMTEFLAAMDTSNATRTR